MASERAEDLVVVITRCLVAYLMAEHKEPVAEDLGNKLGAKIESEIVRQLGGVRLTIPTLRNLERRERHRQINNKFTGANHGQLAFEFGCSRKTIYNIVAKKEG